MAPSLKDINIYILPEARLLFLLVFIGASFIVGFMASLIVGSSVWVVYYREFSGHLT